MSERDESLFQRGSGCFKIRCKNCGHEEIDTWMGDIYTMTNSDGFSSLTDTS